MSEPADTTSTNRRIDIGAVNQAVIDALLCRKWAELDRLVPRTPLVEPSPEYEERLYRVE